MMKKTKYGYLNLINGNRYDKSGYPLDSEKLWSE